MKFSQEAAANRKIGSDQKFGDVLLPQGHIEIK